jgi:hypothetical protein
MNTSAAIADPLLRRASGQRARPSDPPCTARVRIGSCRSAGCDRAPVDLSVPKLDWLICLRRSAADVFVQDAGYQALIGQAFLGGSPLQHFKVGGR